MRRSVIWPRQPGCSARRLAAAILVLLGLLADLFAGTLILVGAEGWGLLLHVPAILVWVLGLGILLGEAPRETAKWLIGHLRWSCARGLRAPAGQRGECAPGRWTLAALLLGLLVFPGLGSLSCTVAFGLAAVMGGSAARSGDQARQPAPERPTLVVDRLPDPLLDLDVQPLVDVLRGGDPALRRAAVAALGRQAEPAGVQQLRHLLTDPDPDVRNEAALALFRLTRDLDGKLQRALTHAEQAPHSLEAQVDLARLCHRYVSCNLADEVASRLYLSQAEQALRQALALAPERAELWLELARIRRDLSSPQTALAAVDQALAYAPDNVDAYLLGMDIAFNSQDWSRLVVLARQGCVARVDDLDADGLLSWWASAHPQGRRTRRAS